jgi:hypothetical protein
MEKCGAEADESCLLRFGRDVVGSSAWNRTIVAMKSQRVRVRCDAVRCDAMRCDAMSFGDPPQLSSDMKWRKWSEEVTE